MAPADAEWDALARALNEQGVTYLAPVDTPTEPVLVSEDLFARLAASRHVRLREAAIPLLLRRPELAASARRAIDRLAGDARLRAMLRYCAACALQRMWRTRLAEVLGPRPAIEPAYLDELALPSLDRDFGRATLAALSALEDERFGHDAWAGYESLMDLFLAELRYGSGRAQGAGPR